MNVLITGGTGQLGFDIVAKLKSLNIDISAPTHNELDITNQVEVAHIFEQYKPDIVVNPVPFTKLIVYDLLLILTVTVPVGLLLSKATLITRSSFTLISLV